MCRQYCFWMLAPGCVQFVKSYTFLKCVVYSIRVKMRYSLIPKVKLKNKSQSRIGEIQNNPYYLYLSLFFFKTCLRAVQLNVRKQVSHSLSKMLAEYLSFHLGSNCYYRGLLESNFHFLLLPFLPHL